MAAANYLTVDQNQPMGLLAIQIRDLLLRVIGKATELDEALGQAAADDNTLAFLQSILGTESADDANAVKGLAHTIRVNLADGGNAFAQYVSRVNRAGF
jgi:hypothetical protein